MQDLLHSTTLLIVDDELDLREVMRDQLLHITPNILLAENGLEALAIVKSQPIDAILSDINMPKMNGLQFLAEMRFVGIQTPFVILTGYADRANILEALRLDATDFLEKPYSSEQLEKVVGKILELGYWLRQMDCEVDAVFANSGLPADEVIRLKHLRKVVDAMKISRHFYSKKTG